MPRRYRNRARLARRRPRRVRPQGGRGRPARLSAPMRAAVRRIVSRAQETKLCTALVENNVEHNSSVGVLDYYRVLPNLYQGVAEYQRIGDRVHPVSLTVRGTCAIDRTYVNGNRPICVRIMVLALKSARSWQMVQSQWPAATTRLLKMNDEGGTENIAFSGSPNDLYYPVNRDLFQVLGERFIKLSALNLPGNTPGVNSVEAAPLNTITRSFNIHVRGLPKTLSYGAASDTAPTNFAPFISVGYAYMDGTGPDLVTTQVIMNVQSHLRYKDA